MNRNQVVGVLLAGGLSRRMGGGDKCLRELGGQTILARIVDRAGPQVGALVLNANGDPARFAAFGLPVATDAVEGRSEEHTSELQSLMRISYAVFCLKKKKQHTYYNRQHHHYKLLHEKHSIHQYTDTIHH